MTRAEFEARKLVAVRMTVHIQVEVPADWDDDMVEFWLNESSQCANNQVRDLQKQSEEWDSHPGPSGGTHCWCGRTSFVVDREWWEANGHLYEDDDDDTPRA